MELLLQDLRMKQQEKSSNSRKLSDFLLELHSQKTFVDKFSVKHLLMSHKHYLLPSNGSNRLERGGLFHCTSWKSF